jgi:hypothetical protein
VQRYHFLNLQTLPVRRGTQGRPRTCVCSDDLGAGYVEAICQFVLGAQRVHQTVFPLAPCDKDWDN